MPFFHCFGCVVANVLNIVSGVPLVTPSEWFDPEATLHAIQAQRCNALYGVPTMFRAQLQNPNFDKYDVTSLRKGLMAGSDCPPSVCEEINNRMHLTEMIIGYGLTECSPDVTLSARHEPIDLRLNTAGKPIPGVEVRIINLATGEDVSPGEQGEIVVRGHNVMSGYYKRPEATSEAIDSDGWLRTGDLGQQTETGHYKVTGRIKDVIIRGGENLYPREIEEFLLTHPKIREAQVTGLPDEHFGEQVCAWIKPIEPDALTEEEVVRFCKESIARAKAPHYVVFVDSYPMTASGKVQKFKLRERGIEKFNLQALASS